MPIFDRNNTINSTCMTLLILVSIISIQTKHTWQYDHTMLQSKFEIPQYSFFKLDMAERCILLLHDLHAYKFSLFLMFEPRHFCELQGANMLTIKVMIGIYHEIALNQHGCMGCISSYNLIHKPYQLNEIAVQVTFTPHCDNINEPHIIAHAS